MVISGWPGRDTSGHGPPGRDQPGQHADGRTARPRRAGHGVPAGPPARQLLRRRGEGHRRRLLHHRRAGQGVSFPIAQEGVRAQLGRLLAYALKVGAETADQRGLIEEALKFRDLPSDHRGVAPTLRELAGPGRWAADPQYAGKIAWIAGQVIGGA
jgi:hypothetical protein